MISFNRPDSNWIAIFWVSLILQGCYKWEATDKPLCGVTVTTPHDTLSYGGQNFVFSGSVVANLPDSVLIGVTYEPHGYEEYVGADYQIINSTLNQKVDQKSPLFKDSILVLLNTLPGRYKTFSLLTDTRGNKSDTISSYRRIIGPQAFPSVQPYPFRPFTDAPVKISSNSRLVLPYYCHDTIGLDSVFVRLCQVLDSGNVICNTFTKRSVQDTALLDTALVDFPISAVPLQRFRVYIQAQNRLRNSYIWKPLYQIQ